LSTILYSDATTLVHISKSTEHPVYLSLSLHNRKDNKANFASAKRILYQHCFNIMTQPIHKKGINEFNKCLAEIPRFPGFKSFKHGLGNIETFMDSELVNFQMITDWQKSLSALKEYGAINSFTAETYESLHRFCVKIPYRISNH
ncbi:21824_t:CDS:2, partial [Entrophospora sp. SA101]